mmetsp:Transcript_516/g.766  ORF Transcript_516/g.766 Transcript_516/m.766 type:complete len:741 (+) Transcript_516:99-2321(+)
MMKSLVAILLTWNAAYSVGLDNSLIPEQIHLAFGTTPDTMSVQWATMDTSCSSSTKVWYGQDRNLPPPSSYSVEGSCFSFNVANRPTLIKQSHHVASMTKLTASTKYFYKVGDGINWSSTYSFTTAPNAITLSRALPQKFIIVGDMASQSLTTPSPVSTVLPWITDEVRNQRVDMILHLGDFAYDMDSDNGNKGRRFMNDIAASSSFVPYMVNVGNHEAGFNFAFYNEFFRNMPVPASDPVVNTGYGNTPNNWYYSWNVGLVHFVTLSSEIYYFYPNLIADQWNWFKSDLQAANNNRTAAPWIIVNAHRGLYCSCDSDCDSDAQKMRAGILQNGKYVYGLEQLLYQYGVDLWLNGHEHNYERMYDIEPNEIFTYLSGKTTKTTVNPPGTVYIVTGDGGNYEDHEVFTRPQPTRTAFRTDAYGYSRMAVYNATHLHWEQVICDLSQPTPVVKKVVDSFWLVQFNHGPFGVTPSPNKAPTAVPTAKLSSNPTLSPTKSVPPTRSPSGPTMAPVKSSKPTKAPTAAPTKSSSPSSRSPSLKPTTSTPSTSPTTTSSARPSISLLPAAIFNYSQSHTFTGKQSYLYFPSLSQPLTNYFTLSLWVTPTVSPASVTLMTLGRSASNFDQEFLLETNSRKNLVFWDYSSAAGYGFSTSVSSTTAVPIGVRTHVAFVRNNLVGYFYINGVLSGQITTTTSVSYKKTDLYIGVNYRDGTSYYSGAMDHISIFPSALSASDITKLYSSLK